MLRLPTALALLVIVTASRGDEGVLRRDFGSPPTAVKPGCYWWWLDGLVTKEAITRDLSEFAAKGIGEVLLVNSANLKPMPDLKGTVKFLSPEWRELYRHALREADRLGIAVGVNLCGGWCMGGPWIPPRFAGRWLLQARITVEGPRKFSEKLPLPGNRDGYDHVFNPPGFQDYIDLPLAQLDYRDTAVVAFPDTSDSSDQLTGERAKLLAAKSNRRDASNHARARDVIKPTLAPWMAAPGDRPVPVESVVNLTRYLKGDGQLEWDVPPGRWTIVRTGHRMTGSRVMIPPPETDGLSVGWLSGEGVDLQFKHLGEQFLADAAAVGTKLAYFCDDSFEDGFPNWTEKIIERFQHYRGYDPVPYLPVLSGYIVGSAEISDRFLFDYRKTVADCMADGHYSRFAELCHEHGLLVQNESAGPSRSGTMCMDGLKNLGRSDRPMGEFWLGLRHDEDGGEDPKLAYGVSRLEDGQNKVTKMVASAAHLYGKRWASAESFTSNRHWLDYPGSLKHAADRAFCEGINRLVIHCSTLQRPEDGKPGYEYYAGTHFNPNVTWWEKTGPFLEYLARCQYLLQQGHFVADVLYYNGDGVPNLVEPKHIDPSLGAGFDYDVCNEEVLLSRLAVRDGRIVLPEGMSYRILVLPATTRMPVRVMAKIKELVAAGATVVGPKPDRDSGLQNYPVADDEVRTLAAEVWGDSDGREMKPHRFGRGRVFANTSVGAALASSRENHGRDRAGATPKTQSNRVGGEEGSLRGILSADGVGPDFATTGDDAALIDFIHRSTGDAEIYFVANRQNRAVTVDCHFRVGDRVAEIWDPVSGQMGRATKVRQSDQRTELPMEFAAYQSFFVVFPRSTAASTVERPFLKLNNVQEITGAWTVRFDPKWGGPSVVEFSTLEDWTKRPEESIRYYSGTATYVKRFDLMAPTDGRLFLDLGVVKNIADVRLNGKPLGILWTAPWRIEITNTVRASDNVLEIEVVNLWPNRLIGDAALPTTERKTWTNIPMDPKASLLPSGLLGPVVIQRQAPSP